MSLYLEGLIFVSSFLCCSDMTGAINIGVTDPRKIWILLNLFWILNSDSETVSQK
jgi:hypothetical protein